MSIPVKLHPDSLTFQVTKDVKINALPLGEDDFLVAYGHGKTVDEMVEMAVEYFKALDVFTDNTEYEELEAQLRFDGIEQVWARASADEDELDEWYLSWKDIESIDEYVIPITLLRLQ